MLFYIIVLIIAGMLLIVSEVFIPSGGILGLLAAACIVTALVLGFRESSQTGLAVILITILCTPVIIAFSLKIFPKTPFGRRVILKPDNDTSLHKGTAGVSDEDYSKLVGEKGMTVSELRPSGTVEIGNKRYGVVTEGEMIEKDCEIIVVKLEGNSIVVERIDSEC